MVDNKQVSIFGKSVVVERLCEYFTSHSIGYDLYLRVEPTRRKVHNPNERNSYLDIQCSSSEYNKIKNYIKLKNIDVKVAVKHRYKTIIT